jgi:hypothetical protein
VASFHLGHVYVRYRYDGAWRPRDRYWGVTVIVIIIVFDIEGRIAGIVDAGTPDGNGITYATPIDWFIKDLQEKYYSVRLL